MNSLSSATHLDLVIVTVCHQTPLERFQDLLSTHNNFWGLDTNLHHLRNLSEKYSVEK